MENLINQYILHNWQRKLVALIAAIIIWFFVDNSITSSKTIPNVPIRIINIPSDKTILGLLPNGILSKRITLTLTGTKDVIDTLEPGDLEVLVDASNHPDEWIVQITKKNLISLDPNIDLSHHVTSVSHVEFVIKLTRVISAKIPVTIGHPTGFAPNGYDFLDIWPRQLTQTVTGPEEQVLALQKKGIELNFDLSEITKSELDGLKNSEEDEVSYPVPPKWKQISVPFKNNYSEEINDPEAQHLHIDFLKKDFFPLAQQIPLSIFFPPEFSAQLNPKTLTIAKNSIVTEENGISYLSLPLYAFDVSRAFLQVIQNNLEIVIIANPQSKFLDWSVEFINPNELENRYIESITHQKEGKKIRSPLTKQKEVYLRNRFREYLQKFTIYTQENKKLKLRSLIDDHSLIIQKQG